MRCPRSRSNTQNITLRLLLNVLPYDRVDKSLTCATPRKNKGSSKIYAHSLFYGRLVNFLRRIVDRTEISLLSRRYVVKSDSIPCQHRWQLLNASVSQIMCTIIHLNGAIDVHKLDTTFQADFISERHRQRHYTGVVFPWLPWSYKNRSRQRDMNVDICIA